MTISTGPILVVEDIGAVRELIEVQLRLRGYRVLTARDGLEALQMMDGARPAVVVTDILMPRMDGFALAHCLRADPQTTSLPIIFLSATYVSAEDERFAMDLGALRFLPKPIDADELFIAVADALTGQTAAAPLLSEREFFFGYRQRLESKLRDKAAQIARGYQQLDSLSGDQRDTYQQLLAETQAQYDEIQGELGVLLNVLREME
ncbi:MAG: response regulator [Anaerolineales bacterium]|nr:response regulator [Anaerolineales bacterium]